MKASAQKGAAAFTILASLIFGNFQIRVEAADECGVPPDFPNTAQSETVIKGTLEGKAQVLSTIVRDASLAGAVEATRRQIYQQSDAFYARLKLRRVSCVYVLFDNCERYES